MLELRPTPLDHPDAGLLIAAIQQVYVERYGSEDATVIDPREFDAPGGLFLVGYVAGEPVACGGWRQRHGGEGGALRDGDAEVKRMYVAAAYRGKGYARTVLAELEHTAAAAGLQRIVLETGTEQPEAIALYASAGYAPMSSFGAYAGSPTSRYYAKPLAVGAPAPRLRS